MKKTNSDRIEAEVILRPFNLRQNTPQSIRPESVKLSNAPEGAMEKITDKLRGLGFDVVARGSASISIAGPKALFERFFKLDSAATPESETLEVPDEIKGQVEGIYVQRPPKYFEH